MKGKTAIVLLPLTARFVAWWRYRQARKLAKKYNLDFVHKCCFRHQIINIGEGIEYGYGEIVRVPMKSGKIALYKLTSERVCVVFEDTGQRNWYFEFQGYAS